MSPVRLLLDADAFLCLRKFAILDSLYKPPIECIMTQFIARHELSPIQDFITELEGAGRLTIEAVTTRTPAYECYKSFLKQGVHKGEAEAIAWAITPPKQLLFISNNTDARQCAHHNGLSTHDVMDLMVLLVEKSLLTIHEVRSKMISLEDQAQFFCKPSDFTTFDETWAKRLSRLK